MQESSDSCDSETTVTSHVGDATTPVALEYPIFEEARLHPTRDSSSQNEDNQEEFLSLDIPSPDSCINGPLLSLEQNSDRESTPQEPLDSVSNVVCTSEAEQVNMNVDPTTDKPESSENLHVNSCGPASDHLTQRRQFAFHVTQQRSSSLGEERPGRVWVRDRDLLTGTDNADRNPLKRSSSLPTSPQSPSRVVTSLRIQLGRGSIKRFTPPSYTYHYEEGMHGDREEVDSIIEEDEDVDRVDCHSVPFHSAPAGDDVSGFGYGTPPHPLNLPQHLTRSSSSLYSVPADWPPRPLGEGPSWSTCSVPNLAHFGGPAHPPPPPHGIYSPHLRMTHNSSYPTSLAHIPHHSPMHHPPNLNGLQSNAFTPPQGSPFTPQRNMHFSHPYYNPSASFHSPHNHPQSAPYGSSFDPYQAHIPPYGLTGYNNSPHPPGTPPMHPYYPLSYQTPPAPAPAPAVGSTEMQLRRVLHDIRGTMQNLNQVRRIAMPCQILILRACCMTLRDYNLIFWLG